VRPGEIVAENVARRFVVRARDTQTLKDILVARGRTGAQEVWALEDVSLHVAPGEAVGLIGRNGSGKSTLLRLVAGIIRPTRGRVAAAGRIGSLLELGAGFHPDFTGRENVFLNGAVQGLTRAEIRERFDEIVAFAEIEDAIDRPVRTYSSGMTMRLGFAVAAFVEADTLLLEEVFAVGDEAFQRKCFAHIAEFKQRGGTIVFVSHDAAAVERLCDRAVLLADGLVAFDGPVHEALARYRTHLARLGEVAGAPRAAAGSVDARLVDASGEQQAQFLAGQPLTLELTLRPTGGDGAPRVRVELRDDAGLLIAEDAVDTALLGRPDEDGSLRLRLDVPQPPLQFGRFHLSLELVDQAGRGLGVLAEPLTFVVYPDGDERGLVRLGGTWSVEANEERR
jgi:ABC-type polysaccharide/polyol phosphate transport system ATPase subunit